MAQQVEASAEGPKRVVAIAVDESENARAAFECKYISHVAFVSCFTKPQALVLLHRP